MSPAARFARALLALVVSVVGLTAVAGTAGGASSPGAALDRALERFVAADGGPPGIAVVVQRGSAPELHTAGVADLATGAAIGIDDSMRLASVAKAFSGAAALALVGDADGTLNIDHTVGDLLPDLPQAWADVTLAQLLQHTSGIPDFSRSEEFQAAVTASLTVAPPPEELLAFVADEPVHFPPGARYRYSNSDNIIVALMIEAATGRTYEEVLAERVFTPLELGATSLPAELALPTPTIHGYALVPGEDPEDATEVFAPGWAWASGGVVSTPADATRFVRGYVGGDILSPFVLLAQFRFRPGSSEPPGPGRNGAGMALFRYETRCGDVYGHTGNTPGYTQFVAADRAGARSVTVSVNAQITPDSDAERFKDLRKIFELGVCAAMRGR